MDIIRTITKVMRPVVNRVMLMLARGVLRSINDAGGLQVVQAALLDNELRVRIERFQNYGQTSHPHPGAEAAVVFLGGNRDHGIVVAVDDRRHRPPDLQEGEVMTYASPGQYMHMREDGALVIKAPGGILLEVPDDQMIKLKGGTIMRHAKIYDGYDVAGYADKLWWLEQVTGEPVWWHEVWFQGAVFKPTLDHGIHPPEVPSEPPDREYAYKEDE